MKVIFVFNNRVETDIPIMQKKIGDECWPLPIGHLSYFAHLGPE